MFWHFVRFNVTIRPLVYNLSFEWSSSKYSVEILRNIYIVHNALAQKSLLRNFMTKKKHRYNGSIVEWSSEELEQRTLYYWESYILSSVVKLLPMKINHLCSMYHNMNSPLCITALILTATSLWWYFQQGVCVDSLLGF